MRPVEDLKGQQALTGFDGSAGQVQGTVTEVVSWQGPTGHGEGTVVWLPVDRLDPQVASAEVTATERARAAGYTFESDRLLSLASAWLARRLVSTCLDLPPLDVTIVRRCSRCAKPHGRPVVAGVTAEGATVQLSATRSRGLVGVAISTSESTAESTADSTSGSTADSTSGSTAVGLDLENLQARGPEAWPAVWRALGRPKAPADPTSEPDEARDAATAWVRTEALLKATGQGLSLDPRSVDISHGQDPGVTRWPWGDPTGRVSLLDLSPGRGYVAALAVIHDGPTETTGPWHTQERP